MLYKTPTYGGHMDTLSCRLAVRTCLKV